MTTATLTEKFIHTTVDIGAKRPYVLTQCLLGENGSARAYGIAICSYLDQYNRKIGNAIARGRATKALQEQRTYSPIRDSLWEVLGLHFGYKGVYFEAI